MNSCFHWNWGAELLKAAPHHHPSHNPDSSVRLADWEVWFITADNNAPQHLLKPLCHFAWPTSSWLSCCHSPSLHFVRTQLTAHCGIFSSEEISQSDLLHRYHRIAVSDPFFHWCVEAVCRPRFTHLWLWKRLDHLDSRIDTWILCKTVYNTNDFL